MAVGGGRECETNLSAHVENWTERERNQGDNSNFTLNFVKKHEIYDFWCNFTDLILMFFFETV